MMKYSNYSLVINHWSTLSTWLVSSEGELKIALHCKVYTLKASDIGSYSLSYEI